MQETELARLIHEALEQGGWDYNPISLAQRVRRLDIGLPLEDEFSIICGWLGKCKLVHKLDQKQYPSTSNNVFQVPDLLAILSLENDSIQPFLIEVKSNQKNKLSFTPEYVTKLKAYAKLLNLPILIAWKHLDLWLLVSLDDFKKADKNFNLKFEDAVQFSQMGSLLGDFLYTPAVGAAMHLRFNKKKLLDTEKVNDRQIERWEITLSDVYFTNVKNEKVESSTFTELIFRTVELEEQDNIFEDYIIKSFVVGEDSESVFAHIALARILAFSSAEQGVRWRQYLTNSYKLADYQDFRTLIEKHLEIGVVNDIFDISPAEKAQILNVN